MIALLDTNKLDQAEEELGESVEQLLTPLTMYRRVRRDQPFAMDNGGYSRFSPESFRSLLRRESDAVGLCRWVVAPDVPGDARRTLELFDAWEPELRRGGWKVALAAQDGLQDLPVPWHRMDAVFIGGSTAWKTGEAAKGVIRCAKALGIWVHAGRVNTPGRWEYFEDMGVDSIDGTGLARYTHMREAISNREERLF